MIITLTGANFSASKIGTLSTWSISRSLGAGATYNGPMQVDKNAALSATVTIATGYELGSAGVTVTMGGATQSGAASVSGNVVTISISKVTGNVVIKVPTINTSTGEEDEGGNTGGNESNTGSVIDIATSGAVFSGMGYTLDSTTYQKNEREQYFVYEYIPVSPNTTYESSIGAGRMWRLKSDKTPIDTLNIYTATPQYQFTTTEDTTYVSISYGMNPQYDVAPDTNPTLTVISGNSSSGGGEGGTNTAPTGSFVISTTSAQLNEGKNITASSATDLVDKTGYFTYMYIPVQPNTTYKAYGGTRMWFYNSSKAGLSTINIYTNESGAGIGQYLFKTPSNCAYVSISYDASGVISPAPVASTAQLEIQ